MLDDRIFYLETVDFLGQWKYNANITDTTYNQVVSLDSTPPSGKLSVTTERRECKKIHLRPATAKTPDLVNDS
jgi:hypothetical protein